MYQFESDGFEYQLTPLKVKAGRRVQLALARTVGPLFGEKADIADALTRISEADLDLISDTFAAACTFDDKGQNFRMDKAMDAHFSGRPMAYWRWLGACITAEYADFFGEMRKLIESLRAQAQTPTLSKSPVASTGTSGE